MRPLVLAISLVWASSLPAVAQTAAPAAAPAATPVSGPAAGPVPAPLDDVARGRVDAMFKSGRADAGWFSDSFLSRVTLTQLDDVVAQLTAVLGTYRSIDGSHHDYTAHFDKGTDEVLVQLDADGRINAILFRPAKF